MRVEVKVPVDVDPRVWADTYGLQFDTVGSKARALRADIDSHVKATVLAAAAEALVVQDAGAKVVRHD